MPNLQLTHRDREILQDLGTKVKLLSLRQIADGYFLGNVAHATQRMGRLQYDQFIVRVRVNARTVPAPSEALSHWNPGDEAPNYSRIASRLSARWRRRCTRIHTAFMAGVRTAALLGVKVHDRVPHILQASHDLGLSSVYLQFKATRLTDAGKWIGEGIRRRKHSEGQVPDALLAGADGVPERAIEYGGLYTIKRLARFHRHCAQRSLGYEIW